MKQQPYATGGNSSYRSTAPRVGVTASANASTQHIMNLPEGYQAMPAILQRPNPMGYEDIPISMGVTRTARNQPSKILQNEIIRQPQTQARNARQTRTGAQKLAPIKAAVGYPRFDVKSLFDMSVNLPIRQILDMSPAIRREVAQAMQTSAPRKRTKKTAQAVNMAIDAAPAVTAQANREDEEVECLFITSWINGKLIHRTLLDTGSVVELVSPNTLKYLGITQTNRMEESWAIKMANDEIATIKEYVWLSVNVEGVLANVKAFVIGMGDIYDLLLSKKWMRKVRAVEDHGTGSFTLKGNDGVPVTIVGKHCTAPQFELVIPQQDGGLEEDMAEDAIEELCEEIDNYDYLIDHTGKA
jgi:hypothetical protein